FLPWLISLCCNKSLKTWITNWWNTRQCETFLNDIQEKSVLEKFIQLEELFQLDEMIKEYPETDLQQFRLGIHKETIQFIKIHNEYRIHTILHFSTNLISFVILSGYSFWGKEKLFILNSWVQEFLYNLSDTIKAFSILLLTDLCIGFHSPHGWELMIGYIYKDFGFAHYEQILSGLVSTFPVILDTIFKYWIFRKDYSLISVSLMIYIITWASISSAYPIFAQQNYENPREATGRIVCANCHLASKPWILRFHKRYFLILSFECGSCSYFTGGFELAPPIVFHRDERKDRKSNYRPNKKNILVIGPVPGGNRGRDQIYPDGQKSQRQFTSTAGGIIIKFYEKKKGERNNHTWIESKERQRLLIFFLRLSFFLIRRNKQIKN
ncbi:LOW QUALITY PROTEIN: hypothetical protein HID58_091137, partial [Brassica napus]